MIDGKYCDRYTDYEMDNINNHEKYNYPLPPYYDYPPTVLRDMGCNDSILMAWCLENPSDFKRFIYNLGETCDLFKSTKIWLQENPLTCKNCKKPIHQIRNYKISSQDIVIGTARRDIKKNELVKFSSTRNTDDIIMKSK